MNESEKKRGKGRRLKGGGSGEKGERRGGNTEEGKES